MSTEPSQFCMVYCTCPDQISAEKIANALIDQHLAACVNVISQITSIYRWQGKKERGQEVLLLIKTELGRYNALEKAIKANHPYELPEVIAVPLAAGSKDYLRWINENVTA